MAKLEMEHSPVEANDKWGIERWYADNDSMMNKSPVTGFEIEKDPNNGDRLTMVIGFDAEHYQGDKAALRENVEQLLDGNGFDEYEVEGSAHAQIFSVKIKGANPGDLTRLAGALSNSVDLGQGVTTYNVLDKSAAIQISDLENDALGKTEAFSVNRVTLENQGKDYLDYESNIPGAVITMLEQDGQSAAIAEETVTAEKTRIVFNVNNKSEVIQSLKSVNADYTVGVEVLQVNEPIHEIARVLRMSGLLPNNACAEIAKAFAEVRSTFTRVSDVEADRLSAALKVKNALRPNGV